MPHLLAGADWPTLAAAARAIAPEAFADDGHPLNLIAGEWGYPGRRKPTLSPLDGTAIGSYPMLDLDAARRAVKGAAEAAPAWAAVPAAERRRLVVACLAELRIHRDLIALLLVWEIGKTVKSAGADVDRCLDGVEWYVDEVEGMLTGRRPVGVVSNIASWNYPLSVLFHAVLVQALAGNAVVSKTPTGGGLYALTVVHAVARRHGLPVTLVSGSGGQLSDALVRNEAVDCLAFVGGKTHGRDVAAGLYDRARRYMLEMEGVNAYGVWDFSDWAGLASQITAGYEYGKQRCTAYVRFVVQRTLFPKFLDAYIAAVRGLRIGHPLLVDDPAGPPPDLHFGPQISPAKVEELNAVMSEAVGAGAVPLVRGELDPARFFPAQDTSAYFAPVALLGVPRSCRLYHHEPFGPVDTIVLVDRVEELVAEMNVSNGALVASVACDDPIKAKAIAGELRAFKVGVNRMRSRGDKAESFGGVGQSWKGCFVGGEHLVRAVTHGPTGERVCGNFPDYSLLPDAR
jgi:acyl-CoA reductase-like NAD-dependent aldehyde dehydrogenase